MTTGIMRLDRLRIGTAVTQARVAAGVPQDELARRLGVSRQYVARLESGEAPLPADAPFRFPERMRDIWRGAYVTLLDHDRAADGLPLDERLGLMTERLGEMHRVVREAVQSGGVTEERAPEILRQVSLFSEQLELFRLTVQSCTGGAQ